MRRLVLAQVVLLTILVAGLSSFGDVRPALRPGFLGGGETQLPNGLPAATSRLGISRSP